MSHTPIEIAENFLAHWTADRMEDGLAMLSFYLTLNQSELSFKIGRIANDFDQRYLQIQRAIARDCRTGYSWPHGSLKAHERPGWRSHRGRRHPRCGTNHECLAAAVSCQYRKEHPSDVLVARNGFQNRIQAGKAAIKFNPPNARTFSGLQCSGFAPLRIRRG
jgi:hypothetical protein